MSETSATRLARLLALVPWLRVHDGVTIDEAAAHFGVSAEQLTTDLWQLIVCGIPGYGPDQLVDIQFWDDDRIHVLDPISLGRPLRLTNEETAALSVALRVLAQVPGDHDRAALRSAIAKLEQAGTSEADIDVQIASEPEVAQALSDAIAARSGLLIEYASGHTDTISRRAIAPYSTVTVDGRTYIEAWCAVAQAIRTFRLDRIVTAVPAPSEIERPVDDEASASVDVASSPVLAPESTQQAVVAVHPDASWVWDSDPVRPDGGTWSDGWATGTVDYASEGWLMRYIFGRGGSVVLVSPGDLRQRVAASASARAAQVRARTSSAG